MRANKPIENMVGGEISPLMHGRTDAPIYAKSLAKMENFLALPQGGAQYRNGFVFVTNTRLNQPACLYPFQFSDQQSYAVEVTPGKLRFYSPNGIITGNDTLITAVTKANPAVVTSAAHGYANGDKVTISGVLGMTQLNGNTYTVAGVTTNTYQLSGIDSTGFTTYVSGGAAMQIVNISAITNANPGVITATHHQFANGDAVFISGVKGLVGLTGQQYLVAGVTTNTFTLTDIFGNAVDTTTMGSFTGTAIVQRVYEIANALLAADVFDLQHAQSADTMYVTHQNYEPQKLIRKSNALWTFGVFTRTGTDPFTGAGNWPRCVSFDSAGRLWYGGTKNNPQTIYGSDSPDSGATHFDRFTVGTAATNSVTFTLAPLFSGKVDYLEWISNTNQFMVLGTFGSVRSLWGSAEGSPVTPTAVTSLPANVLGCAYTLPVANGDSLFYVQRGSQRLRSLEYDFYISGFTTKDQTLASEHLLQPGLKQIIQQRGTPDILWSCREDGKLLGFTYSRPEQENYASWHRHYVGGSFVDQGGTTQPYGFIKSVCPVARTSGTDQLWISVQREINGQTIGSVEYMADYQPYPYLRDFYTGKGNKAADTQRWLNALYETEKSAVYLDMANLYDGSSFGTAAGATLTPASAAIGMGVVFTASQAVFNAAMVGRELRKQYDLLGNGGGRAVITAFTDSTHVTCSIVEAFNNTTAMDAGAWFLTATILTGLDYLEGETVQTMIDGGPGNDKTVTNGTITLDAPAATAVVGYGYTGTLETLNLDIGGRTGSAATKPRVLIRAAIQFLNTLGAQFGTDYYRLEQIQFRPSSFQTDRPVPLFSGNKMVYYEDEWTEQDNDPEKKMIVIQELPLPCTVLRFDPYVNTTDE